MEKKKRPSAKTAARPPQRANGRKETGRKENLKEKKRTAAACER
jgi:hypothetical protein